MILNLNNDVKITGDLVEDFKFGHMNNGEEFYISTISIPRNSGTLDVLKLVVPKRTLEIEHPKSGDVIKLRGNLRTYHLFDEKGNVWNELRIFSESIRIVDQDSLRENYIFLRGDVWKTPRMHKTKSNRIVTDVLLRVHRKVRKSDYIPCICWGRNAVWADLLEVGSKIEIEGRIQSRDYRKGGIIQQQEYEVSVSGISTYKEEEDEECKDQITDAE